MEFMIKIILFTTFFMRGLTASEKCQTDEVLCIKWCCNSTDFFKVNTEKCEKTWKYFNLSLDERLHVFNGNHRYMNLLLKFWHDVSVPCLNPDDMQWSWNKNDVEPTHTPDYCFSRHYTNETKEHRLEPLDCATEFKWYRYSRYIIILGLIFSILLLLSTIWIYTNIKELKDNMRLKLFIWYIGSLVTAHTSMVACVHVLWNYGSEILFIVIGFISSYFFMSTFLCMNVIGFEIWITFRELSAENSLRSDQKRFICYAVYVWSVPIIFYILYFLTLSSVWSFGPVIIILLLNFVTFVYLSCHICSTRYGVVNLRDNDNIIQDTAKIILSIFFMMGIPRLIFFIFLFLGNLAYYMISKYVFLSLEAPLIFKLFVLKKNVWTLLKNRYSCYKSVETNTGTDDMSSTL